MQYLLASYPRSGNTFFRVILSHRYGIAVHTDRPPPAQWGKIGLTASAGPDDAPLFYKTHGKPERHDPRPAVYVLRDGRDALVSYAYFSLAYGPTPDSSPSPVKFRAALRNIILETNSAYGTWAQNATAWATRPNTALIRYEDLVADPCGVADRALAVIGLKPRIISDQIPPFGELKEVDGTFFRRGVIGGWRDEFPADLLELFWQHNGPTMLRHGYPHHGNSAAA